MNRRLGALRSGNGACLATQSMRRGQVRLMGMAKMSIATVFFALASNIVEVERWRLRQAGIYSLDAHWEIKTRTPRRHTRQRLAAIGEGEALNLDTGEITTIRESPPPA